MSFSNRLKALKDLGSTQPFLFKIKERVISCLVTLRKNKLLISNFSIEKCDKVLFFRYVIVFVISKVHYTSKKVWKNQHVLHDLVRFIGKSISLAHGLWSGLFCFKVSKKLSNLIYENSFSRYFVSP